MSISLKSILENILANIAGGIILYVASFLRDRWLSARTIRDPKRVRNSFLFIFFVWLITNGCYSMWSIHVKNFSIFGSSFLFLSSILVFWLLWRELRTFWDVGIAGADLQVKQGIDYRAALSLCKNEVLFMGTGASKLTKQENFEEVLTNLPPNKPVRFLLSRPSDAILIDAVRRAGRSDNEYKNRVIQSLREIKRIKESRSLNLEVRFYPDSLKYIPNFRLMIIDDTLCLLSYNFFGQLGEGTQLPQLHLVNPAGVGGTTTNSFYYPFKQHFDWLWELSEEWDFQNHL